MPRKTRNETHKKCMCGAAGSVQKKEAKEEKPEKNKNKKYAPKQKRNCRHCLHRRDDTHYTMLLLLFWRKQNLVKTNEFASFGAI